DAWYDFLCSQLSSPLIFRSFFLILQLGRSATAKELRPGIPSTPYFQGVELRSSRSPASLAQLTNTSFRVTLALSPSTSPRRSNSRSGEWRRSGFLKAPVFAQPSLPVSPQEPFLIFWRPSGAAAFIACLRQGEKDWRSSSAG